MTTTLEGNVNGYILPANTLVYQKVTTSGGYQTVTISGNIDKVVIPAISPGSVIIVDARASTKDILVTSGLSGSTDISVPAGTLVYLSTDGRSWSVASGGGGASPGFDFVSVAVSTALTGLDDAAMSNGTLVYVRSQWRYYSLNKTSTDTLAPAQVIATKSGTGRFLSVDGTTSLHWALAPSWIIDSVAGNDDNDGSTNPLKTFAEVVRRWGPSPVLRQTTTITIAATGLVATDVILIQGIRSDRFDRVLIIRGTMGAGVALAGGGILTGASNINRAVADSAQKTTIATQVWGGLLRKFVRVSGGARDGATAAVTKDLTGGQARNSPFLTIPAGGGAFSFTEVSPAIGDVLVNVTPSICLAPLNLINNEIDIRFENLEFSDDAAFSGQNMINNFSIVFNFCIMHGYISEADTGLAIAYQGCIFMQDSTLDNRATSCLLLACAFIGTGDTQMLRVTGVAIDADTIIQGAWSQWLPSSGLPNTISACSFYDETNAARAVIDINQGIVNSAPFFTGSAAIGGTGIAGYLLKVENGGWLLYSATANFVATGATSLIRYSGANKAIGDLPLVLNGNNNAIVPLL